MLPVFCLACLHLSSSPDCLQTKTGSLFIFSSSLCAIHLPRHLCPPLNLPAAGSLSAGPGHGHWSVSAFTLGVFDGLSLTLTALWVSTDKGMRWDGISPLVAFIWDACKGICRHTFMLVICMKSTFFPFSPAVLVNLMNLRVLPFYSYVCQSAEGVTVNLDNDLCHIRLMAGSRNRSKMSLIRHDSNSGQRPCLPVSLPFAPSIVILSFQLILSIRLLLDLEGINVETRARKKEEEGRRLSCLLCHFMLTRCKVD